jgi:hypothetical protein
VGLHADEVAVLLDELRGLEDVLILELVACIERSFKPATALSTLRLVWPVPVTALDQRRPARPRSAATSSTATLASSCRPLAPPRWSSAPRR